MNVSTLNQEKVDQLRSDFRKDGYVFLPGFLDNDEMKTLWQNLKRVFKEVVPDMPFNHKFYENEEDEQSLKQLQHLYHYDSHFNKVMFGSKFEDIAKLLLEDEVVGKNLQYFNKPPKIGKPTPPHQDGYYFMLEPSEAVTMWLALEDVDEENGCVRYIPGSHLMGVRNHAKTSTLGFSQGISDYGSDDYAAEKLFPAKPGDLLIHHAMTIHRADGNSSSTRNRQALGFIYYAEKAKEDTARHEAYQKQLAEEMLKK